MRYILCTTYPHSAKEKYIMQQPPNQLPISPYTGEPYDPAWGVQRQPPRKKHSRRKFFAIGCGSLVALVVLIAVIAAVANGGSNSTPTSSSTPTAQPTHAATTAPTPTIVPTKK